jgi:uncharacterized protein (DUF2336 family)
MIVRQFLHWLRSAPAGGRADATAALARAYLYSDLTADDRTAFEGAMIVLLDDPSPMVRRALAETLASSDKAPPSLILALASDQPKVANAVLERSPLLLDSDLIDLLGKAPSSVQPVIARRASLPRSVAAALAETATAEACLVLLQNESADIAPLSIDRIAARHAHLPALREALLARKDLPAPTRQAFVSQLSQKLAGFVAARDWLQPERAERIAKEACEKATIALAADAQKTEVRPLIRHLRQTGQLTAGLLLRALLSGNVALFEEALADLSGLPLARVAALVHDKRNSGLRAVYEKAGLPLSVYPAFREAVTTMHEDGFVGDPAEATRLRRRMVERVLTGCEDAPLEEIEPLLTLLRRFATEAAREEARLLCAELMDGVSPIVATRLSRAA